jgi:hypothetical protein
VVPEKNTAHTRVSGKMATEYEGSDMNESFNFGLPDELSLFRWTLKLLIRGSSDLCDLPDNQVHMNYCTMGFIKRNFILMYREFFLGWIRF